MAKAYIDFLLLVLYVRILRNYWIRIILVVKASVTILVIICAYVTFFALIGFAMLSDYPFNDPS